jgi:hypothetical protein
MTLHLNSTKISDNKHVICFPYTDSFPFIIDEAKPFFSLDKSEYQISSIAGKQYLTIPHHYQIPLKKYIDHQTELQACKHSSKMKQASLKASDVVSYTLKYRIQKILVANWILGILKGKKNDPDCIFLQSFSPYHTDTLNCICLDAQTVPESGFYNLKSETITKSLLNEWFDDDVTNFYKIIKHVTAGIDPNHFKNKMRDIILKHDNKYITWLNDVVERLNFLQNKFISYE